MITLDAGNDVTFASDLDVVIAEGKLKLGSTAVTATAAELNLLDGVTGLVQADLTKLAAIDATAAEINDLAGNAVDADDFTKLAAVTSTAAELNYLDNDDLEAADFTKLAAVTATATELNVLDADTGASVVSVLGTDRFVMNDVGSGMVQVTMANVLTFLEGASGINSVAGNLAIAGTASITGDLVVNGTTTTVNTDNLTVKDENIVLRQGGAGNADGIGFTFGSTSNTQTLQTKDSSGTQKLGSSLPLSASAYYGDGSNLTNIAASDAIVSTSDIADQATSSVGGAGFHLAGNLSQNSIVHLSNSVGHNEWLDGEVVYIKLNDANNTLSIKASGTQKIDGVADRTITLETQGAAVTLIKVGTDSDSGWFIV